jgi:two-component system, response regulator
MDTKPILLVEDNPDDELLTLRAFERNNIENKIIVARDGAEALDYLFGTGIHADRDMRIMPQIILLDLQLPKISGLEVLQQLRSNPHTQFLPVVILTSSKEEHDIIKGHQLRADSYIRKPVDFDKFVEVVKELKLYWQLLNEEPIKKRGS